jgi:hypothetical protein
MEAIIRGITREQDVSRSPIRACRLTRNSPCPYLLLPGIWTKLLLRGVRAVSGFLFRFARGRSMRGVAANVSSNRSNREFPALDWRLRSTIAPGPPLKPMRNSGFIVTNTS